MRMESALWSVAVAMFGLMCRQGVSSLNKVAADPEGAPVVPAVAAVNPGSVVFAVAT